MWFIKNNEPEQSNNDSANADHVYENNSSNKNWGKLVKSLNLKRTETFDNFVAVDNNVLICHY